MRIITADGGVDPRLPGTYQRAQSTSFRAQRRLVRYPTTKKAAARRRGPEPLRLGRALWRRGTPKHRLRARGTRAGNVPEVKSGLPGGSRAVTEGSLQNCNPRVSSPQ